MGGVTPYDEAYDMCRRDHGTLARALDRDLERFLGDYVSSQQQNYDKSVFRLSLSPALLQHLVYSMYSVLHLICIKTTYMYIDATEIHNTYVYNAYAAQCVQKSSLSCLLCS